MISVRALLVLGLLAAGAVEAQPLQPRPPHEALTFSGQRISRSPGGALYLVSGRIENSDFAERRDPRFRCVQLGNSGTVIRANEATLFEVIPARGRKDFRGLELGIIENQAKSVSCEIISARR